MNARCAYHPDKISISACVTCAAPLCGDCRVQAAGTNQCARCAANARPLGNETTPTSNRFAAPPPNPGFAPVPPQPSVSAAPGFASVTPPSSAGFAPAAPAEPSAAFASSAAFSVPLPSPVVVEPPPAQYPKGILYGALVGGIGAFLWEKIYFHASFSISWFYILLGIGIGAAVVSGSRRHGALSSLLGGGLTVAALAFGHYLLMRDVLGKLAAEGKNVVGVSQMELYQEFLKSGFDFRHWAFVAIGVFMGFYVAFKDPKAAAGKGA